MFYRTNRALSQHYLKDKNIAKKIVSALSAKQADIVIEIGPGTGSLTEFLIKRKNINLHLIEIDRELIEYLKQRFSYISKKIYRADFLKFDLLQFAPLQIALIGNLPYHICNSIFFKIINNRSIINEAVCMVQKEVAQRYLAQPCTKEYGKLTVLLQAFYEIKYLFSVSKRVFSPVPEVDSAVIHLIRKKNYKLECNENLFFKLVKTAFIQRRKMLHNSLKSLTDIELPDVYKNKRVEELSIEDFIYLVKFLESQFWFSIDHKNLL